MSGERTVGLYRATFIHQAEEYTRQTPEGRYVRTKAPLTDAVLRGHLLGQATVGLYLLDAEDRCAVGVIDHDDKRLLPGGEIRAEEGLGQLQDMRRRLERQGIDSAVEESRRGGHLWVFAREPVPGREMRALLRLAFSEEEQSQMRAGERAFELYPKQDTRGSGVGSAIRAPCGIHQKSMERYPFVDTRGHAVAQTLLGQVEHAAGIERADVLRAVASRPWLHHEIEALRPVVTTPRQEAERDHPRTLSPRGEGPMRVWNQAVDCRAVVEHYGVTLDHTGVGRCPWPEHHAHGDRDRSFQVGRNNRWFCHTLHEGGSALDFVMKMEGVSDPREGLRLALERFPVPELSRAAADRGTRS